MNSTFKNMFRWQYVVGFLLVWVTLTAVNLHWLIDDSYLKMFVEARPIEFFHKTMLALRSKDPGYFLMQNVMSSLISFEVFFGLLIFACLALKFSALLQVTPNVSVLDVLPYLLVLGFLHEGIQVRVALALSIGLWAILLFAKNQRLLAFIILGAACTFHISATTFFLVFLLVVLYKKFGYVVLIVGLVISACLAYTTILPDLLIQVGVATNARFLHYSQGPVILAQNKTGLFQYFFLWVTFLTGFIWVLFKPVSQSWKNLKIIGVISGLLAVAILQIFRFNVVVSSRLADLLLLPVLIVLGGSLVQLKNEKKYGLLTLMVSALVLYCFARSYISFKQAPLVYRSIF